MLFASFGAVGGGVYLLFTLAVSAIATIVLLIGMLTQHVRWNSLKFFVVLGCVIQYGAVPWILHALGPDYFNKYLDPVGTASFLIFLLGITAFYLWRPSKRMD